MSDRRVDRVERPRDEGIYVSRIGEEKKEKQKYSELPSDENKNLLLATFFSYLKKVFDTFSPSKKIAGKIVDIQQMIKRLEAFKALLVRLGSQDLSSSADFAIELSDLWCLLLEDYDCIEVLERKQADQTPAFRTMIDTIKNYPPDSEHRFGYYLLEHAGKDWLPFPFIEILEKLHKDYLDNGESSTLTHWTSLIDDVIHSLHQKTHFQNP